MSKWFLEKLERYGEKRISQGKPPVPFINPDGKFAKKVQNWVMTTNHKWVKKIRNEVTQPLHNPSVKHALSMTRRSSSHSFGLNLHAPAPFPSTLTHGGGKQKKRKTKKKLKNKIKNLKYYTHTSLLKFSS